MKHFIKKTRHAAIFATAATRLLAVHCASHPFQSSTAIIYPYPFYHHHEAAFLLPPVLTRPATACASSRFGTNNRGSREKKSDKFLAIERNKKIDLLSKKYDWRGILRLYQEESKTYDNINLSTTMSRLARIRSLNKQDPLFLNFVDDVAVIIEKNGIKSFGVRAISNILHAIGKMELQSNGARKILNFVDRKENVPLLFGTTQALTNIAWAFGNVGVQAPNLFAEINEHASWLVRNGNTQDVSNTVLACAKLGLKAPDLFLAVNDNAAKIVAEGTPQAISNTAWACAKLGVQAPKLFALIDEQASWLVGGREPQNIANTAWACATLGVEAPNLFSLINDRASWLVENGKTQEIANTAWACATLGVEAPNLFLALNNNATKIVTMGNPQEIANSAWSIATLGYHAPNFFNELEKNCHCLVSDNETIDERSQHLSITAIAFAKLGLESKIFFSFLGDYIPSLIKYGNTQEIGNICYSFAVLDLVTEYHDEFLQIWNHAISLDPNSLVDVDLKQFYMAFFYTSATGIDLPTPPPVPLDKDLSLENKESRSQQEVSQLLAELGFDHEIELCPFKTEMRFEGIPDDFLAIDIVCPDRMIAIEFDGPSHFLKELGTGKTISIVNGPTKAKQRFLQRLGWTVISIPFSDWMKYRRGHEKRDYLVQKLKEAGVAV